MVERIYDVRGRGGSTRVKEMAIISYKKENIV